jgi:hypothetical protein
MQVGCFFRFSNSYKLFCYCCACALDCNGFWRSWLDSHELCVIATIFMEDWEDETKKL